MPESALARVASSPLVTNFAQDRSQKVLKKSGIYVAPLCTVPTLNFRYQIYDSLARFTVPDTKRQINGDVTQLSFGGKKVYAELEPNALDLPIPSIQGLSDEDAGFLMVEAIDILSEASALALEVEQLTKATGGAGSQWELDWTAETDGVSDNDPIYHPDYGLDQAVRKVMLAAPGVPVKILVGVGAMMDARANTNIRNKIVVGTGGGENVGLFSLTEQQLRGLIFANPEVQMSVMAQFTGAAGTVTPASNSTAGMSAQLSFILDHTILVFASNDTPNRFDASFMKTFSPMAGFMKPGTYIKERGDIEVAKMDWTTLPLVTNAPAAVVINTKP